MKGKDQMTNEGTGPSTETNTQRSRTQRVIVVFWDGMRPDLISAELTPNLHAFAERGTRYQQSVGVLPSVTRPTTSSVSTGTYPGGHGVIANLFVGPPGDRAPIDTGMRAPLDRLRKVHDGRILRMPTLAEALAAAGRRFVAMGSGSIGQAVLLDPERAGTTIHTDFVQPESLRATIVERFGAAPAKVIPVQAAHDWLTNILLEYVLPEIEPDVVIMWLCEPDASQHAKGLGSPEARAAIQGNDARLGRILDAVENSSVPTTVIVGSDHGHSTVTGMVRMEHAMQEAGFGAALTAKQIYLGDAAVIIEDSPEADSLRDGIGAWLAEQPWVGALVNWADGAPVNGTLTPAATWNNRARDPLAYAPAFTFSHTWTEEPNPHGVPGSSISGYAATLADFQRLQGPVVGLNRLTSTHGTLGPRDQRTVLILGGTGIRPGTIAAPAGVVDLAPTILALLGLPPLSDADGRVLTEAFADGPDPSTVAVQTETVATLPSGPLRRHTVGTTAYLDTSRED
jgi:phosphonoacetate hydrolase